MCLCAQTWSKVVVFFFKNIGTQTLCAIAKQITSSILQNNRNLRSFEKFSSRRVPLWPPIQSRAMPVVASRYLLTKKEGEEEEENTEVCKANKRRTFPLPGLRLRPDTSQCVLLGGAKHRPGQAHNGPTVSRHTHHIGAQKFCGRDSAPHCVLLRGEGGRGAQQKPAGRKFATNCLCCDIHTRIQAHTHSHIDTGTDGGLPGES